MPRSNLAVLTQSHKAIAAKKRAKREQIKEIVFDDDARRWALQSLFAFWLQFTYTSAGHYTEIF